MFCRRNSESMRKRSISTHGSAMQIAAMLPSSKEEAQRSLGIAIARICLREMACKMAQVQDSSNRSDKESKETPS